MQTALSWYHNKIMKEDMHTPGSPASPSTARLSDEVCRAAASSPSEMAPMFLSNTDRSSRNQEPQSLRPACRAPRTLTRRHVLAGAMSSVALAALAPSALLISGCSDSDDKEQKVAQVDEGSVASLGDYTLVENEEAIKEVYTAKLPLGTVVTSATREYISCLMRGEASNPVSTVALYHMPTATRYDVLSTPYNTNERRSIYDVTMSDQLVGWVEIDYSTNIWELYVAPFATSEQELKAQTRMVDHGSAEILPPSICCYKDKLVWTVSPHPQSSVRSEPSHVYLYTLGATQGSEIVESPGQFGCDPTLSATGILVLSPREAGTTTPQYRLVAYNINTELTQINQMTMPASVRPFAATYMADKFGICIEANYGYGGALGKMGTYFGVGTGPYVGLMQEPDAAPAYINDSYVIKHRGSMLIFDDSTGAYCRLSPPDAALDWGDYPVVRGESSHLVTFATVKDPQTSSPLEVVARMFELSHITPPQA